MSRQARTGKELPSWGNSMYKARGRRACIILGDSMGFILFVGQERRTWSQREREREVKEVAAPES